MLAFVGCACADAPVQCACIDMGCGARGEKVSGGSRKHQSLTGLCQAGMQGWRLVRLDTALDEDPD